MVAIASRRATLSEEPGGLRITVPARPQWLILLFLSVWLALWVYGGGTVILDARKGKHLEAPWFTWMWLAIWVLVSAYALFAWLWQVAGREVIAVRAGALVLRREIFGIGRSWEYDLRHVRDVRALPTVTTDWTSSLQGWGVASGAMAFDYGPRTYRFAGGLDEAEAKEIARWLQESGFFPRRG
jgi:hypothetical protein